ncbi:MAG: hypothetical protein K940chlam5_00750 [Candidatus Anoxychlamydiales bacterium]|nr:hypothetical protein [Candidatus Anoxychlamydiales bacterium]
MRFIEILTISSINFSGFYSNTEQKIRLYIGQTGEILRTTNESYQKICEAIAPRLTQALEKLEEWDINTIDIVTNIEFPEKQSDFKRKGIIFLRKLDIGNTRLYLVALCLNKKVKIKSYEYLPILANNLKNLLESFE